MNLCSDGHDEVCYEGLKGKDCPSCAVISEKDEEIKELQKRIQELENLLEAED